jgi:hypothetical protein
MRTKLGTGLVVTVLFGSLCVPAWAGGPASLDSRSDPFAATWAWAVSFWHELVRTGADGADKISFSTASFEQDTDEGTCRYGYVIDSSSNPPRQVCQTGDPDPDSGGGFQETYDQP